MKKLNLATMLLGASLLIGVSIVSLSAHDMKCGAGKCGASMHHKSLGKSCIKNQETNKSKKVMKCGAGKCGAGKCGSK